jgi:hypothetical protein
MRALHSRVVDQAWVAVDAILSDRDRASTPRRKIERIAELFFLSESKDVAEMGSALQDAEIYFEDRPEFLEMERRVLRRFVSEVRPRLSRPEATFQAELLITVLEKVGKTVAARRLPLPTVRRWAHACAGMLATQLLSAS